MACNQRERTRQRNWLKQDNDNSPVSPWYELLGDFLIDMERSQVKDSHFSYSLLTVFKLWVVPSKKEKKLAYDLALIKVLEGTLLSGNKPHGQILTGEYPSGPSSQRIWI